METKEDKNLNRKYLRAKKRVDELKGFYTHLTVFLIINTIITVFKIINDIDDGDTLKEALLYGGNYNLWFWWGIGIAFHAYGVFGSRLLMSKDWEERKIKEFMDEK